MASTTPHLDKVHSPADLRRMDDAALKELSVELRRDLIESVSRTGGHLGSSLGVVELTVALHSVFNTPYDKLIWDVGHQCYPHKILTGRRSQMSSLRQGGGLSGFTKRSESAYDPFGAAHSSTSISAGFGFSVARDLGEATGDAIAVIGDGAISGGMAYEALNNAGADGRRMFVILNDNEMSIAPPVGAMSHYMSGLLPVLRAAKTRATGPVLIHCLTVKGKGYAPAETSADKYHGVSKFDVGTGAQVKSKPNAPSYTSVFGKALTAQAQNDPKIVGVTAAMPSGTGINILQDAFPERVFDVGIAEQHGVTFAAGLAASGLKPFCAIYSTFLQRAYDQIVHDVALQNLPVRFAIDRAGLVGADGATHAGSFDVAYLANLPNFTVMAAADEAELIHMVATAAAHNSGPIAFRYPRGEGVGAELPETGQVLPIGKGRIVREGNDVAILSFGAHLSTCLEAAELMDQHGVSATIADARFAKPLDTALIVQLLSHHKALITIEQGADGGFGAHVLHWLAREGRLDGGCTIRTMTLPDRFIDQASPQQMYEDAGLTATDIAATALQAIGSKVLSTAICCSAQKTAQPAQEVEPMDIAHPCSETLLIIVSAWFV